MYPKSGLEVKETTDVSMVKGAALAIFTDERSSCGGQSIDLAT